jgi:1-acyl-sn-glycerol-3-phosphate acyltransferase
VAYVLTKRRWAGRENLPADGGFIVATNHISSMDWMPTAHFLAWWALPPQVLVKESLFRMPVVGAAMRAMHMIPVYRGTSKAGRALEGAETALAEGRVILIYPEGTVTKDPDLWPMRGRPGAVKLALDTGAPLIPLAQWGAQRLLPKGHRIPHLFPRTKVWYVAGPAMDLTDLATWEDRNQAARAGTERLMRTITEMEAKLRGQDPPAEVYNQFAEGQPA